MGQNMLTMMNTVNSAHVVIPDYVYDVNPPSLFTYYYTLPKWARDDPFVKNVVMAYEYHKPLLSIRDKEQALNMACSMLRPVDKNMMAMLSEAAISNKLEMTMERVSLRFLFYSIRDKKCSMNFNFTSSMRKILDALTQMVDLVMRMIPRRNCNKSSKLVWSRKKRRS